jgi:hypothetical protein
MLKAKFKKGDVVVWNGEPGWTVRGIDEAIGLLPSYHVVKADRKGSAMQNELEWLVPLAVPDTSNSPRHLGCKHYQPTGYTTDLLFHMLLREPVCPYCTIDRLTAERDRLREALEVAQQALLEVAAAQERGDSWYTHGKDGLYRVTRRWVLDGLKAVNAALAGTGGST